MAKTVNLYGYSRFYGNIMCTAEPYDNLLLTKAIGMDKSSRDMPNDSSFSLFLNSGGVVILHGRRMKNKRFCSFVILEIKIIVFTCLLSSEGCDSFPKCL